MKKFIYTLLGAGMLFASTSCEDFLDKNSPSEADPEFVFSEPSTARAAMYNVYELWRGSSNIHSSGPFYDIIVVGSDAERQPEGYAQMLGRHIPTSLFGYVDATFTQKGTMNYNISQYGSAAWDGLYSIISATNTLINTIEKSPLYAEFAKQNGPSEMSEIYGEAVAMRATCYHELIRVYGDVPHQLKAGVMATEITPRDIIADYHINKLIEIEPLMYRAGETAGVDKTFMTRTYVQGLIGRMALMEGGYQTRRLDLGADYYKDSEGKVLSFEKVAETPATKCFYGRRTDWEKYYKIAETYLTAAINNPGTIALQVNDPRNDEKKKYGNPFQYVFQQMMDNQIATENVYEIPETFGEGKERPYAFGRPSSGGGSHYFPCKSYGEARLHPLYYYNDFDPKDLRRDVTCAVTGSQGSGSEKIIPFTLGSTANNGGIALNKWDENRQANPCTVKQRQSGINTPYMRFSDVILMLAEVKATLGDATLAQQYLGMVHNRAFTNSSESNLDGFIAKCGSLLDAVLEERKLEFGGEGIRRYDMIRTNTLGKSIAKFHNLTSAMIADLKSKGHHAFENGNTISNYIWIKKVDPAEYGVNHRLTTTCTDVDNPVLSPGWRGQNDDWAAIAAKNGSPTTNLTAGAATNLAIYGLFKYIDPNGSEASALENQGFEKQKWGQQIIELEKDYNEYVFNGYVEGEAPVYMLPYHPDIIKKSNGVLTNGYGFKNQ